jgi:hypothetical protein
MGFDLAKASFRTSGNPLGAKFGELAFYEVG